MKKTGLSPDEIRVLAYIQTCSGMNLGATAWGCSRQGLLTPPLPRGRRDRLVDNALRRLKRLGLIERRGDPGSQGATWWETGKSATGMVVPAVQDSALAEVK